MRFCSCSRTEVDDVEGVGVGSGTVLVVSGWSCITTSATALGQLSSFSESKRSEHLYNI